MRIDESILLMRSGGLFKLHKGLDWKELSELTAGILDRWKIKMALFDLDDAGNARLKFHSMNRDAEAIWEAIAGGPLGETTIPVSRVKPIEQIIGGRKAVYIEDMSALTGAEDSSTPPALKLKSVFAPLHDGEKTIGVLVAMSEDLAKDDTLPVSLIANELSTIISGSELIRELKESRQLFKNVATKYRDLIDRLDDGIVMADAMGNIIAANEKLRRTIGYTYLELMKMRLLEIVPTKDREMLEENLKHAKSNSTSFETRLLAKDGAIVHTEAVFTYSPQAETYQGIFRLEPPRQAVTTSGSKWVEHLFDRKTRRKRDLEIVFDCNLRKSAAMLFFMNSDGKIIHVGEMCEPLTGYAREEFIQHPLLWLERVQPFDREIIALAYRKAVLTGEGHGPIGFKFTKKLGKICDFVSMAVVITDPRGELLGVQGMFLDVSSVLDKEREAGESARRKSIVFENINDMIFVTDPYYVIQMLNPSCEFILGRTPEEMEGQNLLTIISPDSMAELKAAGKRAFAGEIIDGLVVKALHKNGDDVYLEINASAVFDDRRVVAVRGVARNVTDRAKMREREIELQRELAQKEKSAAIGEMLATASHGIRNPLASIRAAAQNSMLELGIDNPGAAAFANIIKEADRLESRIREFLGFHRPFEPDLKPCSMNEIISESLDMMKANLADKRIEIESDLDGRLPPSLMDFAQLEQVLLNLIGNAVAVMPDGGTLSVGSSLLSENGKETIFAWVEDTGPGIPEHLIEKVFQPFFTTKSQGTGMGLSMSMRIIEGHGGEMRASNGEKGGARIEITIPVARARTLP